MLGCLDQLATLQAAARQRVHAQGLPSRRTESWRYAYAPVIKLLRAQLTAKQLEEVGGQLPDASAAASSDFNDIECLLQLLPSWHEKVTHTVSGSSIAFNALSHLDETVQTTCFALLKQSEAYYANTRHLHPLQALLMGSAASVDVCQLEASVDWQTLQMELLAASQPIVQACRMILVPAHAQVRVVEVAPCVQTDLLSTHTIVHLGEGARLEWAALQGSSAIEVQVENMIVLQSKDSTFVRVAKQHSANYLREDIVTCLREPGAHASVSGMAQLAGKQFVDNHLYAEHAAAHTSSEQNVRVVLSDAATAVFNGAVHVHPKTGHITANQSNNNILLSTQATVNTKPELEIYHDDVQCSHGATVGALDKAALFYLRSRGITDHDAKDILLQAFFASLETQLMTVRGVADDIA